MVGGLKDPALVLRALLDKQRQYRQVTSKTQSGAGSVSDQLGAASSEVKRRHKANLYALRLDFLEAREGTRETLPQHAGGIHLEGRGGEGTVSIHVP